MISLCRDGLLVFQDGLSGNADGIDVKQLPGIDHKLAQAGLDTQFAKAMVQLFPVVQKDSVKFSHLLGRVAIRTLLLQVIGNPQEVFLAVNQVVRPRHVHQLVIQKHLHMAQRFFNLK